MDINNPKNFVTTQQSDVQFGYDLNIEKEEINEITDEIRADLLKKWKKVYADAQIFPEAISAVHPEVRDFLLEFSRVADYDEIAKQAGLDEKGRNTLSSIVWKITQAKNWDNLENEVGAQFGAADSAKLVAQLLNQKIINKIKFLSEKPNISRKQEEVPIRKNEKMSLSQALGQYPNLGEQVLTNNPLKLQYFPTPVKASIKNWITDYRETLGAGKHSTMDRGNFLFHGENGKRLTPIERQKVSLMLKSLDEEIPLDIDGEKQMIVFEIFQETTRKVERPSFQAEKVEADSQEDVAQARIRQSLDFSKKSMPLKGSIPEAAAFEDSNYVDILREKVNGAPKQTPENPARNGIDQSGRGLRFSSAQELPVEKTLSIGQNHNFANFSQQKKVEPEKASQVPNSPDLRGNISSVANNNRAINQGEAVPKPTLSVEQPQPSKVAPKTYSPYIIGPTRQYEKNSDDDMDIFKKNTPKIRGNTEDLS
jgi:hypothetical protein